MQRVRVGHLAGQGHAHAPGLDRDGRSPRPPTLPKADRLFKNISADGRRVGDATGVLPLLPRAGPSRWTVGGHDEDSTRVCRVLVRFFCLGLADTITAMHWASAESREQGIEKVGPGLVCSRASHGDGRLPEVLFSRKPQGFLRRGLWSVSQHPNWFGNLCLWSGITLYNAPGLSPVKLALAAVSPVFLGRCSVPSLGVPNAGRAVAGAPAGPALRRVFGEHAFIRAARLRGSRRWRRGSSGRVGAGSRSQSIQNSEPQTAAHAR